jgi:hypothetical protein
MPPRMRASWGIVLVLGSACGGGDDPPASGGGAGSGASVMCAVPQACGGDVVGHWKLDGVCFPALSNVVPSCPMSVAGGTISQATGDWTFSADGKFVGTYSYQGNLTEHVPMGCLQGSSCPVFAAGSRTCAMGADGCDCNKPVQVSEAPSNELILYSTSGTVLNVQGVAMYDYCVQGSQLHLRLKPSQVGAGAEPPAVLTLTKQ